MPWENRKSHPLRFVAVVSCCRPRGKNWLRGLDLNQRPSGYEPDELPGCSTPRSSLNLQASQALGKVRIGRSTRFVATLSPLVEGVFGRMPAS